MAALVLGACLESHRLGCARPKRAFQADEAKRVLPKQTFALLAAPGKVGSLRSLGIINETLEASRSAQSPKSTS
mgnify:CR=1 FL=1